MSRVTLEPTYDEKKGLWCLYLGRKLSPGKPREYRKSKEDIDKRVSYWKHYQESGQKAAMRAGADLVSKAVHYDELLRDVYGFEGGLAEFCEIKMAELDKELESPPFSKLLDAFQDASYDHWKLPTQRQWDWYRGMLSDLEDKPLASLDTAFWRQWLNEQAEKNNWTNTTFNNFRGRLQTAYKYSIPDLLTVNPMEGVKVRKTGRKVKTVWSLDEIRSVMNYAWEHDREMVPFFAIGIFAGLRPFSELAELKWEHIDWERGHIIVAAEFDNKTGVKRFVPMTENLKAWLQPWRVSGATGRVVPVSAEGIAKRRRKTTTGRAPTGKGADNDVMRHTYGSYMDAATNHDRNSLKEWMGHTDFQTYEQNYRNARTAEEGQEFLQIFPLPLV